jgi:glycosyltransferase involved in cell wall biosynthesis
LADSLCHTPEKVFLIVPAYNEQAVLRETLLPAVNLGYRVVAVDDGSSDGTWNVISDLPVYGVRHPINLGQGAALQTGMAMAIRQGADYIVHFDADGQHRLDDIDVLLEPLRAGYADVVLGSRFLRRDDVAKIPPLRRVLLRGARLVNFAFTGLRLTDAHNGFRAMTSAAAAKLELKENGFAHATEILTLIRRHGLRYVERPTAIEYTEYSQAKGQKFTSAFNILLDLFLGRVFR